MKNWLTRWIARWRGHQAPQDSAAPAALRSDRFRQAREGDWRRLESIVTAVEKGRLSRLSDEDLLDLPVLYRQLASSLAVARETSLDAAALAYLEALAQRAWFITYGPRENFRGWLRSFILGGWSRAVRAIRMDILIALALMVAGTAAGWMMVAHDPQFYTMLVGQDPQRHPGASAKQLRETLFGHQEEDALAAFAAYLFGHNAQIAILCFALGFAIGLPSVILLLQNSAMLGAMLWLFHGQGLLLDFTAWITIHGTTELFAILLAGASGLHIGRAIAFPGEQSIMASAAAAGQRTAPVMLGVVLMLLVAGMLEGFARQLLDATPQRLLVGGFMLVFWLAYFFVFGSGIRLPSLRLWGKRP